MNFRVTQRTSRVSEIQNSETQDDDRRKTRNEGTKGRKANGMKEVVLVVFASSFSSCFAGIYNVES